LREGGKDGWGEEEVGEADYLTTTSFLAYLNTFCTIAWGIFTQSMYRCCETQLVRLPALTVSYAPMQQALDQKCLLERRASATIVQANCPY